MLDAGWEELDLATDGLAQARLVLHHAVQLVAAVGQALAPRQADDSQQSLGVAGPRLWLGAPVSGALRAGLDPLDLELRLADGAARPLARLPLTGRTLEEGLAFLAAELRRRGAEAALELPRHPADFPRHPLGSGARFTAEHRPARQELARLFADTEGLLATLLDADGPPRRLWPHHFDLASSTRAGRRSLSLGVSPGEGAEGSPYWYAVVTPALAREQLPALDGGGTWHLEGWTGAELPSHRLQRGAAAQRAQVAAFFRSAISGASQSSTVRAP